MLYAEGIQKQYLRKRKDSNVFEAVQETTLEVANGKITVIHGRSGSGKSTLLNMLSGILKPTRGRVLLGETDLYQLDDVRRALLRNEKFGVVPYSYLLLCTKKGRNSREICRRPEEERKPCFPPQGCMNCGTSSRRSFPVENSGGWPLPEHS